LHSTPRVGGTGGGLYGDRPLRQRVEGVDRAVAVAELERGRDGALDERLGGGDRLGHVAALRELGCDRGREHAAGAVRVAGRDPPGSKLDQLAAVVEEIDRLLLSRGMPALQHHGGGAEIAQSDSRVPPYLDRPRRFERAWFQL